MEPLSQPFPHQQEQQRKQEEQEHQPQQEQEEEPLISEPDHHHHHRLTPTIDPQIWTNLPSDILEKVLYHFPTISLLRCRTICKDWFYLFSSPTFLKPRSLIPPRDLWFAISPTNTTTTTNSFHAFDPETNRFHTISLSFLPCHSSHILSSSGGLICCKGIINGAIWIFVCNPISKNWRILPPLLRKRAVPIVSIISSGSSFKVVAVGDDAFPNGNANDHTTEVYDSITNRWVLGGSLPVESDLEFGSALWRGNLYLPNFSPPGALCFNLVDGLWTKVRATMPANLMSPSLVECSRRLCLIACVLEGTRVGSIRAWELCFGGTVWGEFARMGDRIFMEFTRKKDFPYLSAVGHGSLICLSVDSSLAMIALNINTGDWIWLPEFPSTTTDGIHLTGSPFNPSLCTAVD